MSGAGRPASFGPDEIQRPGGERLRPVLERATRTVGRGSIKLYEDNRELEVEGGGGSKEPIVTRDGLGKTRTDVVGGGGWFAGRGKSRRRGGMGKQAGDAGKSMLACFDRVQGRRRGQEQRKAEFRARGVGGGGLVKGGGRRTTKSHQSTSRPVKDAGCPPIDAASALNILRKLGVLARK